MNGTLALYKSWLDKASAAQIDLADKIYQACEDHYDAGGDWVLETFEPQELLEMFSDIPAARAFCGVKVEQALNCRWGEDTDPELVTYENWKKWKAA